MFTTTTQRFGSNGFRRTIAISILIALTTVLPSAPASAATTQEVADEWSFVALANQARASVGRPPLRVVPGLLAYARSHSTTMMSSGGIFHDSAHAAESQAVSSCWIRIGENVGQGGSVAALHSALMASATHRNIILGDFTYVGIGVRRSSTGRIWVTQRFMKLGPGCSLPTISPPAGKTNLLRDPSFELRGQGWGAGNGPGINWYAYESSSAFDGRWFMDVTAQIAGRSLAQNVPVAPQPGRTYTFSIWVRSPGPAVTGKVALWALGPASKSVNTTFTTSGTWQQIYVQLKPTVTNYTSMKAEVYVGNTGRHLYLDGAQLLITTP